MFEMLCLELFNALSDLQMKQRDSENLENDQTRQEDT